MILPAGSERGFLRRPSLTLLELLLVIALIAILVGVNFPRLKTTIQNTQFRSFADKVYFLLDYAKTHAVLNTKIITARFDTDAHKISLREPENILVEEIDIPRNLVLEADKLSVVFYPDGTCSDFRITLSDDEERTVAISSGGFDGKIEMVNQ